MRNKREEALAAYYAGTAAKLPVDNPYRWLVQNHDFNPQHRGMQVNCPACADESTPAERCLCGKSARHLTAQEDTQAWACRVPESSR
jgi:hypothetical protein